MNTEEKRNYMLSLVEQWRSSGVTQKTFCTDKGINITTFRYWVARSKEAGMQPGGFVELSRDVQDNHGQIEIIYPTGVRLKVGHDLGLIAQLIRL